jgi:hypothetical protein
MQMLAPAGAARAAGQKSATSHSLHRHKIAKRRG